MEPPRRKLSLTGFLNNLFPYSPPSTSKDADMSPTEMDNLIKFQLGLRHPRYLDQYALVIAKVVDQEQAKYTYNALVAHGFVTPPPGKDETNLDPSPMTVNTHIIGKDFAMKLKKIGLRAHRRIVGLLFFWEEECNRWRILDQQENEILEAMRSPSGAESEDLKMALQAVRIKKMLLPGERLDGEHAVRLPEHDELPSYSSAS